jgi:hypothetical protein
MPRQPPFLTKSGLSPFQVKDRSTLRFSSNQAIEKVGINFLDAIAKAMKDRLQRVFAMALRYVR